MIQDISAVTFAVRDMARSVDFYQKLGFKMLFGGERGPFNRLKAGEAFVDLVASPGYEYRWWGRAIFRVDDADAQHQVWQAQGLMPESPKNGPWGSAFFHLSDPDGHELSFAALLPEDRRFSQE
jgi:catechol 2,3-dioxygenase-like lactoylglutathione lyase family enzyme